MLIAFLTKTINRYNILPMPLCTVFTAFINNAK